jgi:hypothetical protein
MGRKKPVSVFLKRLRVLSGMLCMLTCVYAQPYNFYYGNIHSHSHYSDGNQNNPTYTPSQDYAYANSSAHFDFLGISDHNHLTAGMHLADYHSGVSQAIAATQSGSFVALYGMEYGVINNGGHVLVYGIDSLIGWESNNYDIYCAEYNYAQLWSLINNRPYAFASLAHPQIGDFTNLDGTAYNTASDNAISGTAIRSGSAFSTTTDYSDAPATLYESYFEKLLSKGYHLGPSIDHDNHNTTFGRTLPGRTVVLANTLTKTDILDALKASRYYASDDWNIQVNYTLNGLYMGTTSNITANPTISVTITDPDGEPTSKIQLYYGVPGSNSLPTILTTANNTNTLTYTHSIAVGSNYYYYLKITQVDGDLVWTAPIWIHKLAAPLALELTDFTATPSKTSISLQWKAESTSDGFFTVEHSSDGLRYDAIGEVKAAPSTDVLTFGFDDLNPARGLTFYRLHFIGTDGTDAYSPIISALWDNPDLVLTSLRPNPVSDQLSVDFESMTEETDYWYFLYNEDGREIRRNAITVSKGANSLILEAQNLQAGLYYLILGKPGKRILETRFTKI